MPKKVAAVVALLAAGVLLFLVTRRPYPSDRTPEGAYLRIAQALMEERPRDVFPYLETEAQWACFTTRELRQKALGRVRASYPPAEASELVRAYQVDASATDGPELFVGQARRRGWIARLRRDLSGVARVDVEGERASVVTVRGTRYPLRRRDNGIWGLTIFTAELQAEAERAARDLEVVTAAAADYERARGR